MCAGGKSAFVTTATASDSTSRLADALGRPVSRAILCTFVGELRVTAEGGFTTFVASFAGPAPATEQRSSAICGGRCNACTISTPASIAGIRWSATIRPIRSSRSVLAARVLHHRDARRQLAGGTAVRLADADLQSASAIRAAARERRVSAAFAAGDSHAPTCACKASINPMLADFGSRSEALQYSAARR